jgi:hypothetical protein
MGDTQITPTLSIEYTPIVYNLNTDFSNITNVLLVDTNVQDYNKFVENCNSSTFPIIFSHMSNRGDIIQVLSTNLTNISRIAIVSNDNRLDDNKILLNGTQYFTNEDIEEGAKTYSKNVNFIINLIKTHNVQNIDYLACYTLKYDNWKAYYNILTSETSVIVGASNDQTGNIKYGGDWIMENTGTDIESLYFNEGISNYQGTLETTTLTGDVNITQVDIDGYTFPVTLDSINDFSFNTITLMENINLNVGTNQYFTIKKTSNIIFDGGNFTVSINNLDGYSGLIQSYCNGTIVKNISLITTGTSALSNYGGWIGYGLSITTSFLGRITDCYSNGPINGVSCGAIVGAYSGYDNLSISIINNCYSTSDIIGTGSGGIAGGYCGNNGICQISNCYSKGNILGDDAGGIAGTYSGTENGVCYINNCYSTGTITSNYCGGIAGSYAGSFSTIGKYVIENCYSTGNITGTSSGGIVGYYAGNSGKCTINSCYSMGNITGVQYNGGITGSYAGNSGICTINNCYTLGDITLSNSSGGITGYNTGGNVTGSCSINNCYTVGNIINVSQYYTGSIFAGSTVIITNCNHSNGWDDTFANIGLTNVDGFWKKVSPNSVINQPWKLMGFLTDVIINITDTILTYTNSNTINTITVTTPIYAISQDGFNTYIEMTLDTTGKILTSNSNASVYNNGNITTLAIFSGSVSTTPVYYLNTFIVQKESSIITSDKVIDRNDIYNYLYSYPFTVSGTTTVTFSDNMVVGNMRFIKSSGAVTIGNTILKKITINNALYYTGLVISSVDAVIINNIGISSLGYSILGNNGGWICDGKSSSTDIGKTINNCYSTGIITGFYSGGILGGFSNSVSSTTNTITNCYSTGDIIGFFSSTSDSYIGGIIGGNTIFGDCGTVIIDSCYSKGNIKNINSGGIASVNFGIRGISNIKNCYNNGNIYSNSSGGIVGKYVGSNKSCIIDNCHNTGIINGVGSGGITGSRAGGENISCTITNCYNTGNINNINCGGIVGILTGSGGNCTIINCNSSGTINGINAGGIAGGYTGSNNGNCIIDTCYSTGIISGINAGGITGEYAGSNNGNCIIDTCYSIGNISLINAGGITGAYAGSGGNCTITKCHSIGNIDNINSGGIVGGYAGSNNGNCIIDTCYSTGIISGENAGGITGAYAGSDGNCTITKCNSIGTINGINSGGIVGEYAGSNNGNCIIDTCYSTGIISRINAGGITGAYTGSGGNCTITKCYSTGNINNINCGGIVGGYAGSNNGNCKVMNCYTNGNINFTNGGGIVGGYAAYNGNCTVINCYSTGRTNGIDSGGIAGAYAGIATGLLTSNCFINNCYNTGIIGTSCGGIVGSYAANSTTSYNNNVVCTINNCFSLGRINSNSGGIAGISCGSGGICNIINSYSLCILFSTTTGNGGIIGSSASYLDTIRGTCNIINCYSIMNIAVGNTNSGGIVGNVGTGVVGTITIKNCYTAGIIANTNQYYCTYATIDTSTCSHSDGWSDSVATNGSIGLDIIDGYWKSLNNGTNITTQPWRLMVFITDIDISYVGTTLTYTAKKFPINYYTTVTTPIYRITQNGTTFTNVTIDTTGKIIQNTSANTFNNTSLTYLAVFNGTTLVAYINSFMVQKYSSVLSNDTILSRIDIYKYSYSYPFIINTNNTKITIDKNIVVDNLYFQIDNSMSVQIGDNSILRKININNVSNYLGLVQSTSSTNSVNNTGVLTNGDTQLGDYAGWLGYTNKTSSIYFYGTIDKCYSTGDISGLECGGIVGPYSGSIIPNSCAITNCYSTGLISGNGSGGITGSYFASSGGISNISNCYSTGNINGLDSGGICGKNLTNTNGICNITNCYSTGIINGGGGIVASNSGSSSGTVNINNCYSTGNINKYGSKGSGGIVGSEANNTTINNCYSLGTILGTDILSGGLCGSSTNPLVLITNCYTAGTINIESQYYLGYSSSGSVITSTCNHNNDWTDSTASIGTKGLLNPDMGSKWKKIYTDRPWKLTEYLNSVTYPPIYSSINGGTVTYKNNIFPINAYSDVIKIQLINNNLTVPTTGVLISMYDNTVTLTGVSNIDNSNPTYVTLYNRSGTLYDYADVFYIQALTTTTTEPPVNTTTTTEPPVNTTTTTEPPVNTTTTRNICFYKGTNILTQNGYRPIECLKELDIVKTYQGNYIKIQKIIKFLGKQERCPLYVLQKSSLGSSLPLMDLYMSEGHAYRHKGRWTHMKCSSYAMKLDIDDIEYYNIVIDNYLQHTLIANGIEVESLFNMKDLEMTWNCGIDNCKPQLKIKSYNKLKH